MGTVFGNGKTMDRGTNRRRVTVAGEKASRAVAGAIEPVIDDGHETGLQIARNPLYD